VKINNFALIAIALVGIGLFVLPSTLSMFAGQHSWYDPNNNGIPCTKCHFLEMEELSTSGGPHSPNYNSILNSSAVYNFTAGAGFNGSTDFWGGAATNDRCYGCHQVTGSSNPASPLYDSWANQNDTVHAAVAVLCTDCHPWVVNELKAGAHQAFYEDLNASQVGGLEKENQACIGCHTHVGVNISWTRAAFVSYNVTVDTDGNYSVLWNTSDTLGTNASRFNSTEGYP
jgi:hypothetical protein